MYSKEEQIRIINTKIEKLCDELGLLYANSKETLNAEEIKKEVEIKKQIVSLKKERALLKKAIAEEAKDVNKREPTSSDSKKDSKDGDSSKTIKSFVLGVLSTIVIVEALIIISGMRNKNKSDSTLITPTQTISVTTPTVATTPMPTPTMDPAMVFADAKDEAEVYERAKLVYDLDIAPMLEDDSEANKKMVTVDKIADIISVSNAELPFNEEYTPNTIADTMGARLSIFGACINDRRTLKLYPTHYSMLVPTGSVMEEYAKGYDDLYNKLAEARNTNNNEEAIEIIKALSLKLYNEYILRGMDGNYNPDMFEEYKYFAYGAAVERYTTYALEFVHGNNLTICVPACINAETHEQENVNVLDIFFAILKGKSGKISTSSVDGLSAVFGNPAYDQLDEILEYKNEQKTLEESNNKVLKRG